MHNGRFLVPRESLLLWEGLAIPHLSLGRNTKPKWISHHEGYSPIQRPIDAPESFIGQKLARPIFESYLKNF